MTSISIPLFPLGTVLFPDGYLPLQIFEVRYLDMIKKALAAGTGFGVITLIEGAEVRTPDGPQALADVGTMVTIRASAAPMPGLMQIECIGTSRFRIESSEQLKHGLWMAQVVLLEGDQAVSIPTELDDTANALGNLIKTLQEEEVPADEMPLQAPYRLDECGWVANRWAELLPLSAQEKLRLLALDNPLVRLELIQDLLQERGLLG
ncbi:MAG: LON peptidase substrate-binding domain-containing protein [Herminiimonas sp.]|nr:LON peptidase substrate-binding domain-containing protein [Herminiimonas sp.]